MAKAWKKNAAKKDAAPKKLVGTIRVGSSRGCPNFYANYAEISHTSHDFGIAFVEIPARLSPEEKQAAAASGEIAVDPLAQIIVPPTLIPGLIRALTLQREKYEKAFGAIRDVEDMAAKNE